MLLFLLTFMALGTASLGNVTSKVQLKADLLTGYDKSLIPAKDPLGAVQVMVAFGLTNLNGIDEVKGEISCDCLIHYFWRDEFLTWDPALYENISSLVLPKDEIWFPPLLVLNDINSIVKATQDWEFVRIASDGQAMMLSSSKFQTVCNINVKYFPFDTQICSIFTGTTFYSSELYLQLSSAKVLDREYFSESGEWEVTEAKAERQLSSAGEQALTITLRLKRKPLYLIINTIIPMVSMSILALIVFILPVESGERISFIITVVLSIAVFLTLVADSLPKVSSPFPLISFYLLFLLTITVLICFLTAFSVKLYFLDDKETPIPVWCAKLSRCLTRRGASLSEPKNKINHGDFDKNSGHKVNLETLTDDQEDVTVTWKELSCAIDKLSLIVFTGVLLVCTSIFLGLLTTQG